MSLTQRERAEQYVNGHTATAVGIVLATALIPGAASIVLLAQETVMAYSIGCIYKADFTHQDAAALSAHIGLAVVGGKIAALEAAILAGPFAAAIKPVIAAAIIKILGAQIINYCENKWGEQRA